ncbi:MAG: helix-turn-helix domain-containing protein [Candidatus Aenigmarchaeota archaeon]|nr:helix-turn-helix domain-containing protein [Candidatus Aenigmarchaeota archaeon]
MRHGKEHYAEQYDKVIELYNKGMEIREIALQIGISYSAVYHWVRGLRKPEKGNPTEFVELLLKNGPMSQKDICEIFPKHNEVYLICCRRGFSVKRIQLGKKYRDYSTWYYLKGQEHEISDKINEVLQKYKEVRKKLKEMLDI